MARFTVSDCMEEIPNRFDMTLSASLRARQLEQGSDSFLINDENDKPTVIALREVAEKHVSRSILRTLE